MSIFENPPSATGTFSAEPDPSLVAAIGAHHSLESAVTDLVDNSVDAGASQILLRFLLRDDRPVGFLVVDNGRGMSESQLDKAMVYGKRRDYEATDLGHYGVGLKAASLSQADHMAVFSRRLGASPVGRGLDRTTLGDGAPRVERYASSDVELRFAAIDAGFDLAQGTVVQWDRPRTFIVASEKLETARWLTTVIELLRMHLGLIHHRHLETAQIRITIDQFDVESATCGAPMNVEPLDPFGYQRSGAVEYPNKLTTSVDGTNVELEVHMWPASGSASANFLLGTSDGIARQGLYVYRNGRLLQAGGWNTLCEIREERRFARFRLEMTPELEHLVAMNPEKSGVELASGLAAALRLSRSVDGQMSFTEAVAMASGIDTESRKRQRRYERLVEPGRGFPPGVKAAMEKEYGFESGALPFGVEWNFLSDDQVFDINLERRKIVLNAVHHSALAGVEGPAGQGQAPLVTTLIYMLARSDLKRAVGGKQWQEELEMLQAVLIAAVQAENAWREGRRTASERQH